MPRTASSDAEFLEEAKRKLKKTNQNNAQAPKLLVTRISIEFLEEETLRRNESELGSREELDSDRQSGVRKQQLQPCNGQKPRRHRIAKKKMARRSLPVNSKVGK